MSEKEFIPRPWQVREGYKKITKDVEENKDEIISELFEALEEFVSVCDTAPPIEFIKRIGMDCETAKKAIAKAKGK